MAAEVKAGPASAQPHGLQCHIVRTLCLLTNERCSDSNPAVPTRRQTVLTRPNLMLIKHEALLTRHMASLTAAIACPLLSHGPNGPEDMPQLSCVDGEKCPRGFSARLFLQPHSVEALSRRDTGLWVRQTRLEETTALCRRPSEPSSVQQVPVGPPFIMYHLASHSASPLHSWLPPPSI